MAGDSIDSRSSLSRQTASLARPLSVTAIPRPISGTSRRASSRLTATVCQSRTSAHRTTRLSTPFDTNTSTRLDRSSHCTNNGMPPTSFHTAPAILPRSDSKVPYDDRPSADLSGTREQLHIKAFSSTKLGSPERKRENSLSVSSSLLGHTDGVSERLSPPKREITPRTLMRPIHPSLPRGHSMAHLACLTRPHDMSPSKPVRRSDVGYRTFDAKEGKLDVVDALLESRMTKPEIEALDNVRIEALCNQRKLAVNGASSFPTVRISVSPNVNTLSHHGSSVALQMSDNNFINTEKFDEKQFSTAARQPLFINTALANTVKAYESSPLSYSSPQSGNTYTTVSSSDLSPDPRNVYRLENIAYWTGRFVAASDRTRQRDCDILLGSGSNCQVVDVGSTAFERQFDKLDATRATRVLEELKMFCRTQSAAKGFSQFEAQLKKNMAKMPPVFARSKSDVFWRKDKELQAKSINYGTVHNLAQPSEYNAPNHVPISNAPTKFDRMSGLIKSKTTGNLGLKLAPARPLTPAITRTPGSPQMSKSGQARKVSDSRVRAVEEREARRPLVDNNPSTLYRQSVVSFSNAYTDETSTTEKADIRAKDQKRLAPRLVRSVTVQNLKDNSHVAPGPTAAALESGYGLSPPEPTGNKWAASHKDAGAFQEGFTTPKKTVERRSSGQRSGEFVKKVVGASVREVRKMSRRVGSMGWGTSADDLTSARKRE